MYMSERERERDNLPPLIITPLINKNIWVYLFYYQFRRRHDYPPHK